LFERNATVYLSIVTVAEFLVKVPLGSHAKTIQKLEERFRIAQFNLKAASMAADFVARSRENPGIVRIQGDRPCLMADIKIVASIFATGVVKKFYANDDRFISITDGNQGVIFTSAKTVRSATSVL
jgi:hypothetical protein